MSSKDPAFLFYPGDYLRDTQCLSERSQVAYDRIMCEHMRNICISKSQFIFFTKKMTPDEISELKMVLLETDKGFQIEWVVASILKRKAYSESRRENRVSKPNKHMKNISKSHDEQMENENEDVNENINRDKVEFVNPFGENFSAWSGWLDYKREEHREKYRSPKTEQAAADKLYKLSGGNQETAKLIIQQSIENRWKGLFELKNTSNGTKKTGQPSFDDVQAAFNRSVNQRQQAGD